MRLNWPKEFDSLRWCERLFVQSRSASLFSYHFACRLVVAHAEESGVAELVVPGPLDEAYLHDDLRTHPVGAHAWQADGFGERRRLCFDVIELGAEVEQEFGIKTGADLSGKDKVVAIVVANQQSAEADTFALWIGEATDHKLLRQLAFHF